MEKIDLGTIIGLQLEIRPDPDDNMLPDSVLLCEERGSFKSARAIYLNEKIYRDPCVLNVVALSTSYLGADGKDTGFFIQATDPEGSEASVLTNIWQTLSAFTSEAKFTAPNIRGFIWKTLITRSWKNKVHVPNWAHNDVNHVWPGNKNFRLACPLDYFRCGSGWDDELNTRRLLRLFNLEQHIPQVTPDWIFDQMKQHPVTDVGKQVSLTWAALHRSLLLAMVAYCD